MNRRWIVLLPLLGTSGWLALFGDKTPAAASVAPVAATVRPAPKPVAAKAPRAASRPVPEVVAADDLVPRDALLRDRAASEVDLFGARSWTPPPPPPPAPPPPPVPTAPALPYTYLGKKEEDGAWEVYLNRGEQAYILREGAQLEGTYEVVHIRPPLLTLKYKPLGQLQTLAIGD